MHGNDSFTHEELGEYSRDSAETMARLAFQQLDTNQDGVLSYDEFQRSAPLILAEFALAQPKITATLNGFRQEVKVAFM